MTDDYDAGNSAGGEMEDFRSSYRHSMPWSVVDALAHGVLAYVIGGPWVVQFVPDALVPVLLYHGLRKNRFLPESSWVLRVHRLLHTVWIPLLLLGAGVGFSSWQSGGVALVWFWAAAQWSSHVVLDQLTHVDPHFQKSLIHWR